MKTIADPPPLLYHGARADLKPGDSLMPGRKPDFGTRKAAGYIYLAATLEAAIWGAELALGEGKPRVYLAVPTGPIEDDPNLTDKRFAGNPTMSYRSSDPLLVAGEILGWIGHPPDELAAMNASLTRLARLGIEIIEQ